MKEPGCMKPGCEFTGGGKEGKCTGVEGVLAAAEINDIVGTSLSII